MDENPAPNNAPDVNSGQNAQANNTTQPPSPAPAPVPPPTATGNPPAPAGMPTAPPPSNRTNMALIFGITAAIIILAVAIFLVVKNSSDSQTSKPTKDTSQTSEGKETIPSEETAGNDSPSSAGASPQAKDYEIKTDINAIMTHLEVYYADYGYYPNNKDQKVCDDDAGSDASCLLIKLLPPRGLDPEAFVSPDGKLLGEPGGYQYTPSPAGCTQCESYTLYGELGTGELYKKTSLNN